MEGICVLLLLLVWGYHIGISSGYSEKCEENLCSSTEGCSLDEMNLLTTLPQLNKEFFISFEFRATAWSQSTSTNRLQNVIGMRMPDEILTFYVLQSGKMSVSIFDDYRTITTKKYSLNTWHSVEFSQSLKNDKYMFRVVVDGEDVIAPIENTKPRTFSNVKLYTADNFPNILKGSIKNFKINTDSPNGCVGVQEVVGETEVIHEKPIQPVLGEIAVPVDCHWSEYTAWSSCSASCGDGTRQRERNIETQSKDGGNPCVGEKVETGRCNAGTCTGPKTRKNVADLTTTEKNELKKSLKNVIKSKVPFKNYTDTANIHGQPEGICPNKPMKVCCVHGADNFLVWHRLYMANMEEWLGVALPYWDWTESNDVPDLWEDIPGPFKHPHKSTLWSPPNNPNNDPLLWAKNCVGTDVTHHRRASGIKERLVAANLKGMTRTALLKDNFDEFRIQIEEAHNMLHVEMSCDMADADSASYDPIFYLHHTYVDYQFAYWQKLQEIRKKAVVLSDSEERMEPFDKDKFNKYQITKDHNKAGDALDYEKNLHYTYDKLLFDGKTPAEFEEENNMNNARKKRSEQSKCAFVGIAIPKMAPSSMIKFEICNSQSKCIKGGSMATFGSMSFRFGTNGKNDIFNNYNMIEYDVTDTIGGEGSFDTSSTARITSIDDHVTMSGLKPIMIWRHSRGEQGGTVYLPPGAKKNDYGKFLIKYDEVKERACPYTDTYPDFCAGWKEAHCTGSTPGHEAWMAQHCPKTCNC